MTTYAYKVVPAPTKGQRAKGVKTREGRFANALEVVMNELGAQGWEYQRTDTLPCEERAGLTGRTTTFQNMLVFRRAIEAEAAPAPRELDPAPVALAAPAPAIAKPEERAPEDATETESGSAAQDDPPKDNVNADPTPEKQQSTGVAAE
ncbi:DUF4177 domain-containing protein [Octadecabacter sp. SW4]|uniref:DUF4177 domain-containing protein n=1 Tax=Octadecabacter sp. SW4 TaxID=2602067 RepID=UPI0011C206F1|nr:DUF4177 domain-containing protein [Octadecabacter sp. SW4]QEE35211.1 DUF4177 domain-containing protein [Octadecabacter sp. SW4]